ncbi:Putative transposase [Serratia proteamaculans]|uniref:transposase n=1 Tax=Serratia proteamaculans TaxID=28151 RepID=UPI0010E80E9E|nr:transposase [Serratia proteamaculans]RYM53334.1 hypothetical protein BSQ97_10200 [Serratia proteamaculans]CAI2481256.1 Putative transposase [Serratia proteamaculans]
MTCFAACWKVHFAKKTRGAWRSVKYLGRYLKRPPVAASQLRHYRGGAVVHQYYDHRTQQHKQQKISQEEMLQRYVSHIRGQFGYRKLLYVKVIF